MGFSGKVGKMCSIHLGQHGGHFWRATVAASAARYLSDCELIQFWRLAKKPGFSTGLELMNQPKFEFNRLNCPPTPSVLGASWATQDACGPSHSDRCFSPDTTCVQPLHSPSPGCHHPPVTHGVHLNSRSCNTEGCRDTGLKDAGTLFTKNSTKPWKGVASGLIRSQ